jgi:basic membrane protein A
MKKHMKKALTVLLAFSLATVLFTACGKKENEEPNGTDPSNASGGTAFEPIAKEQIKVGVLHITSKNDTSGYTYAHQQGILGMKAALGLLDAQIIIRDEVPDTDIAKTKTALQELIDADCDIIFATSYNYMDSVEEYAAANKDVIFSHCSGYKSNDVNFNNYFGRIYEARYLSGIAAGLKAKEENNPKIGYVAAMDSTNSEVTGGINAFALGVQSVYPEAQVKVKVTGSWYDPAAEQAAAQALLDSGCGILTQHCDSDVTQKAAQAAGKFGLGYNSDMTASAPQAHITAPIWNWSVYYTTAVQAVISGTWKPEPYFGGLKEGFVDVSPVNEAVAADGTKAEVDAAKAKIISGELVVFPSGIQKADGTVIDHALTADEIKGQINYYLKGVSLL